VSRRRFTRRMLRWAAALALLLGLVGLLAATGESLRLADLRLHHADALGGDAQPAEARVAGDALDPGASAWMTP